MGIVGKKTASDKEPGHRPEKKAMAALLQGVPEKGHGRGPEKEGERFHGHEQRTQIEEWCQVKQDD